MAWGGARVGAGRKPKGSGAVVLGMDGLRRDGQRPLPEVAAAVDALLHPPKGLPPQARLYWRRWAPLARTQGTLTAETVPGFEKLCVLAVVCEKLELKMVRCEPGTATWSELHPEYLKTGKDLRGAMQAFKLCAFGKPEQGGARGRKAANPWAAVGK